MKKYSALLLLGPTGSGKTPLGNYFEANGINNKRCFHFDFGRELRSVAERNMPPLNCSRKDVAYIHRVLKEGALLENETFYIAANILRAFIERRRITVGDNIVLNGLPRHAGQAEAVDALIAVRTVILLDCSPEVVYKRIRCNSGGDRSGRTDDSLTDIAGKLEIFKERTLPLVRYYQGKRIPVIPVEVAVHTTPRDILLKVLPRLDRGE